MNTYKIVLVKKDFIDFTKEYPHSLKMILLDEKSMYDSKQLQLFFETSDKAFQFCQKQLFLREDYSFFHGIHQLKNILTDDVISFVFNQFDIEVTEKKDSFVIYNYLKEFSSNFFMFDV